MLLSGGKRRFSEKRKEVARRREKREALREQARDETVTEVLPMRVTGSQKRWLERKAEETGTTVSNLLRTRSLRGINQWEDFRRTEDWLEEWGKRIGELGDEESSSENNQNRSEDKQNTAEDKNETAEDLAKEIEQTLLEEVFRARGQV